jgi:hypothetical protein
MDFGSYIGKWFIIPFPYHNNCCKFDLFFIRYIYKPIFMEEDSTEEILFLVFISVMFSLGFFSNGERIGVFSDDTQKNAWITKR